MEILLQGDFESCFTDGDNSKILPTDTMKNTVYSLARNSSAECMEEFAKELVDFFLARNPQVSSAEVSDIGKALGTIGGGPEATSNHIRAVERRTPDNQGGAGAGRGIFGRVGTSEPHHHEDG